MPSPILSEPGRRTVAQPLTELGTPSRVLPKGRLEIELKSWHGTQKSVERLEKVSGGVDVTPYINEASLESCIVEKLENLEKGLQLVERQCALPVGRIDILCTDKRGNFVVVEIKKSGARIDAILNQICAYMGYIKEHRASLHQKVRGIIVVEKPDQKLTYAVRANPDIEIKTFNVRIESSGA